MTEPCKMPKWWPRDRDGRRFVVGVDLSVWFFPEWDQWKLSFERRTYPAPEDYFMAIGPLRFRWKAVTIDRPER